MPTEPIQFILAVFEISLLLAGTFLLFRLVFNAGARARWLGANRLPPWAVSPQEFIIYVVLMIICGFFFQASAQLLLGGVLAKSANRAGLELVAYGFGFHGGALLGWLLFRSMRASWYAGDGTEPPPPSPAPGLPWLRVLLYAGGGVMAALPAIFLVDLGWVFLLHKLGLPDEPQDSIAIFANTRSPLVIAGMLLVACVIAPLNEELIFRAGLHRFFRQKLGRGWALLISGCLFGALHHNLAGFLPLAALGAGLALAYEATGSIRVAVVAHGLFNLNTILIVLSGLPQQP